MKTHFLPTENNSDFLSDNLSFAIEMTEEMISAIRTNAIIGKDVSSSKGFVNIKFTVNPKFDVINNGDNELIDAADDHHMVFNQRGMYFRASVGFDDIWTETITYEEIEGFLNT